jgi:hypothetical protein
MEDGRWKMEDENCILNIHDTFDDWSPIKIESDSIVSVNEYSQNCSLTTGRPCENDDTA